MILPRKENTVINTLVPKIGPKKKAAINVAFLKKNKVKKASRNITHHHSCTVGDFHDFFFPFTST